MKFIALILEQETDEAVRAIVKAMKPLAEKLTEGPRPGPRDVPLLDRLAHMQYSAGVLRAYQELPEDSTEDSYGTGLSN